MLATRGAYGPRHAEYQRAVLDYVKLLCSLGRADAAEPVLREARTAGGLLAFGGTAARGERGEEGARLLVSM